MTRRKKLDHSKIKIESLTQIHIDTLKKLWVRQYRQFAGLYKFLSRDWETDTSFREFIEDHITNTDSIIVRYHNNIIGYMTYDMFNFHNEKTAFFPIMAHSAAGEYKTSVYHIMYTEMSEKLVKKGCLNHLCTFFASDRELKEYLFETGFGLYVVDAFQDVHYQDLKGKGNKFQIRKAEIRDSKAIHLLLKEFHTYYESAPLFLKRDMETEADVRRFIAGEHHALFIALKENSVAGFISIRKSKENDPITLVRENTGLIDQLGAYVKKEYRQCGLGIRLLHEVFAWCQKKDIETIHVDFESANPNAHQFWPRYFIPLLFSVKRRINNDM